MKTTSSNKCASCGRRTVFRAYKHVEKVGRYKVNDATAFAWHCESESCGEVELSLDELAGYQRRAAAVVLRDAKEVDGAVMKYARKALGMKQAVLAAHIGCSPETLSRWETDHAAVPRAEQLAVVAILDAVEQAGGLDAFLAQEESRPSKMFEVVPQKRRAC